MCFIAEDTINRAGIETELRKFCLQKNYIRTDTAELENRRGDLSGDGLYRKGLLKGLSSLWSDNTVDDETEITLKIDYCLSGDGTENAVHGAAVVAKGF